MKKLLTITVFLVFCLFQAVGVAACDGGNIKPETNPDGNNKQDEETLGIEFLYFGNYPQSDVTSSVGNDLAVYVGELPVNGNDSGWTSYEYYISSNTDTDFMWYKDVDADNDGKSDYRGVYFTEYRPDWTEDSCSNGYQRINKYYTEAVYWFRFEPIKWKILNENGGKAIILTELILDSQDYNYVYDSRIIDDNMAFGNNYAYSSVRAWLNETFYNIAFNETEKALIDTVAVDNGMYSAIPTFWFGAYNNLYVCDDTNDRVFLLSEREVTKNEYGFSSYPYVTDAERQKGASDYAKVQGTCAFGDSSGYWWLRSPARDDTNVSGDSACFVHPNGSVDNYSRVNCTPCGIVPALQVSDLAAAINILNV